MSGEALRMVGIVRGCGASSTPTRAGGLQELVLARMDRLACVADVAVLCGDGSANAKLMVKMCICKRR